jgi:N-acetylglutamate synthase-like GNAT family acetyltransferase
MWTDVIGAVSALRYSASESVRFGLSIARLNVGTGWTSEFEDARGVYDHVASVLGEADERIVFVRFPSELVRMADAVVGSGRSIVPAGALIYWSLDVDAFVVPPDRPGLRARAVDQVGEHEVAPLVAALEDSFGDYSNHYSANPLLDSRLIVAGYRQWAESTLHSAHGTAYVLESEGDTIGVATVTTFDTVPDTCEIELAGVTSAQQGDGRYRHLLQGIVDGVRASGRTRVVISTQSHNIRVQRAWAAAGFRPVASLETYHAVRQGPQ